MPWCNTYLHPCRALSAHIHARCWRSFRVFWRKPGARGLLLDMAQGYRQQSELAVSRLAQDAESRCAQWLLKHAEPDPTGAMQVTLHQRKRLIAAQLGIAPETFSRVLRHLRELGLIHGTGNVLNLPQPRALQSMAGC